MDHNKKLDFIHKMSKLALDHVQHFDSGGTVLQGPSNPAANNTVNSGNGIAAALGLNNSFQANGANIQGGTNAQQLNNAYTGAQTGLTQQQLLANELAGQTTQGVNTQTQLTQQLENIAKGTGPNPAATQLASTTGKTVANTAALMAGQRGASANPALIAREAAQQGAVAQQEAAGQGATLQAQQSLAAQQQLANLAATQVGQSTGQVNTASAANQGEQGILQNANTATNNANVGMQSNINSTNAAIASGNQQAGGKSLGGIASGIGSATGLFAKGGEVGSRHMAGPYKSHVANFFAAGGKTEGKKVPAMLSPGEKYLSPEEVKKVLTTGANPLKLGKKVPGKAKVKSDSLKNDTVPATLEEGGLVLPKHIMNSMSREKAELFVHKSMSKGQRK